VLLVVRVTQSLWRDTRVKKNLQTSSFLLQEKQAGFISFPSEVENYFVGRIMIQECSDRIEQIIRSCSIHRFGTEKDAKFSVYPEFCSLLFVRFLVFRSVRSPSSWVGVKINAGLSFCQKSSSVVKTRQPPEGSSLLLLVFVFFMGETPDF